MRKAAIGQIAVLAFMAIGGVALKGLAIGDAQWQYHTNRNQCDSIHYIYTTVPISDKENGGFSPFKIRVPCNEWPKKRK
jgi:hypothetical protein